MREVELHATISGITPPWKVVNVAVDVPGEQATVKLIRGQGRLLVRTVGRSRQGMIACATVAAFGHLSAPHAD